MIQSAPERTSLPEDDTRRASVVAHVRNALHSLPAYYTSGTNIEGLEASDLFNLNTMLSSSIEIQVVDSLNNLRTVWDPDGDWPEYTFIRSASTFPDVRLVARIDEQISTALGIELKGWYLLSKESAPSYRYKITPSACSPYDLLVVVPWHLKNVLSGMPVVREPYIEQAKYVAEYRNYWWQYIRQARGDPTIIQPENVTPLGRQPRDQVNDEPRSDSGGNFGRIARIGVMDQYLETMMLSRVAGIEARHWITFFRLYADAADTEAITTKMGALLATHTSTDDEAAAEAAELLTRLTELLH